jgi:hypothetical protein
MRISVFLRNLLLLLSLASPALLVAQFQKPTDEELKMTSDPKAPGAAAVYLNVSQTANNPLRLETYYARIKVLTEKGKELATVELPYLKGREIADIEGRTIHPDGTVVPLVGKPADLLVVKSGNLQIGRKVFTLPSVEVGSILEYYYQLRNGENFIYSPVWEIQRPYLVHKAHYLFTPDNADRNFLWWTVLPPGMSVRKDAAGRFGLDMTDVPPAPDEEWMPPIESILYKVRFYFEIGSTVDAFWGDVIKAWSKDVDRFAGPSRAIHEAVDGIVSPGDSEQEKAGKLYKAVQELDNTDFSRKKGEAELKQLHLKAAKRAEDTWGQKSGSREDIALLYLAILRAAGLTAYAMKVANRDRAIFAPGYFDEGQLDDTIIILSLNGKEVVLDPGEKMCPFLTMHWKHSLATGIWQGAGGGFPTSPMQNYSENKLIRTAEIALDNHGGMTGDLTISMTGQEALRWRQTALNYDLDEVNHRFDRWIQEMVPEGVETHIDHFQGLDDPGVSLTATVKAHGTLGTATSKRVLLPASFFETHAKHPFVGQETRLEPVDMHYGEKVNDHVVYRLPAGLAIEGAPADAEISWAGHAALVTNTVAAPGQVTLNRSIARAFTFAKPEEYQDLRGFYQKVAAADQQQLVLTTSPTPKGNR